MSRLLAFVLPIIWFPDSGVATIAFAYFTAKSRVILVKLVICGENIGLFFNSHRFLCTPNRCLQLSNNKPFSKIYQKIDQWIVGKSGQIAPFEGPLVVSSSGGK